MCTLLYRVHDFSNSLRRRFVARVACCSLFFAACLWSGMTFRWNMFSRFLATLPLFAQFFFVGIFWVFFSGWSSFGIPTSYNRASWYLRHFLQRGDIWVIFASRQGPFCSFTFSSLFRGMTFLAGHAKKKGKRGFQLLHCSILFSLKILAEVQRKSTNNRTALSRGDAAGRAVSGAGASGVRSVRT